MDNKDNNEKEKEMFNNIKDNVSEDDITDILSKREKIIDIISNTPVLGHLIDDIIDSFSLVKDYITGAYTDIPWKAIAAIIAGLIYLLNPMDVIPDILPIIGFTDDAAVLGFVFKLIHDDLEKYRAFKKRKAIEQ